MSTNLVIHEEHEALMLEIGVLYWKVKDMEKTLSEIIERDQERRIKSIQAAEQSRLKKEEVEKSGTPISKLYLTIRAENCLRGEEIYTLEKLVQYQANDLKKIPNMGKKSIQEVREALAIHGLKLKGE